MPKQFMTMEMALQPTVRGVFGAATTVKTPFDDRKRLEVDSRPLGGVADGVSKENESPNVYPATFCAAPNNQNQREEAHAVLNDNNDVRKNDVRQRRSASEGCPRSRVVLPQESSSSDDDDDEQAEGDEDDAPLSLPPTEHFLIKPMPNMQVCPLDDMVVEEEKRIRRSKKNFYAKNKRHCADADELSAVPQGPKFRSLSPPLRYQPMPPQLKRDSMAIRQQYWTQLGLSLSQQDLARASRNRIPRREGLKVRLNDSIARRGNSKTIFQLIKSWYSGSSKSKEKLTDQADPVVASTSSSETQDTSSAASSPTTSGVDSESSSTIPEEESKAPIVPKKKKVVFHDEAELFYIPLHKDYSKRQRDNMWHQRSEFIAMVERNLDEVYDEMEREFEEQARAEYLENEAMAQEELVTRKYNEEFQKRRRATAERLAAPSPCRSPSPSPAASSPVTAPIPGTALSISPSSPSVVSSSPPMLTLCPQKTQIKLSARAQTSHAIRFKYLKHLGINNLTK